jgi:hypothetical protein
MRSVLGAVLAAVLLVTGAAAEPLAPGKPAGVRQARLSSGTEAVMLGTGAAIMLTVGILVSGGAGSGISTGLIIPSNPVVVSPTTSTSSTG